MRLKKEIKIKLLNLKIKNLKNFQIKKDLKPSIKSKRISKVEINISNLPLLSKKNLKFPLNISYDLSSKNSFIYCKEKNLHYLNNNVFLDNSLGSFQKIYSSLSNSFLLTLFEKHK